MEDNEHTEDEKTIKTEDVETEIPITEETDEEDDMTIETDMEENNNEKTQIIEQIENENQELKDQVDELHKSIQKIEEEKSEEINRLRKNVLQLKLSRTIGQIAQKEGFIEPDDAVRMISSEIEANHEGYKRGNKKISETAIQMHLSKLINNLKIKKPHLISPEWRDGSGAKINNQEKQRNGDLIDFQNPHQRRQFENELQKKGLPIINPVNK